MLPVEMLRNVVSQSRPNFSGKDTAEPTPLTEKPTRISSGEAWPSWSCRAFATPDEIARIRGTSKRGANRIISRLSKKLKPYYRRSVFVEPHPRPYDPSILKTPSDLYL